jgi:hypothetical protein
MDAEKPNGLAQNGQAMIEFAFLIPIVAMLLLLLVKVETVISCAIVNNKYARAQLHFVSFNHRFQLESHFAKLRSGNFAKSFWIGVDAEPVGATPRPPKAQKIKVGLQTWRSPDDESAGEEVGSRSEVRVRVTAFTCLPFMGDREGFASQGRLGELTYAAGNDGILCGDRPF